MPSGPPFRPSTAFMAPGLSTANEEVTLHAEEAGALEDIRYNQKSKNVMCNLH